MPHDPDLIDDDDNPEIMPDDFARAVPFGEIFPAQLESWKKRTGRPPSPAPKIHIGFRLSADIVQAVRASGKGYNARVEKLLREAFAKGVL